MRRFQACLRPPRPLGRPKPCRGHASGPSGCFFSVSVRDGEPRRPACTHQGSTGRDPFDVLGKLLKSPAPVAKRKLLSEPEDAILQARRTERNRPRRRSRESKWKASFPAPEPLDRSAVGGIAADRRALASYRIIRHSPDLALTTDMTKQEAQQVVKAEQFFSHQSAFLYSAETLRSHPFNDHMPEIIVLGASNVGKSSFLNALTGRPDFARVSQKLGRTTAMNAYGVGPQPTVSRDLMHQGSIVPKYSLVLVDTPGYGHKSQSAWGESVVKYLNKRRMLRGAVLLLSSEKGRPLSQDQWVLETLAECNIRTLITLTKADKGHDDWPLRCYEMANAVYRKLHSLDISIRDKWIASGGAPPCIHVTAAGMECTGKLGNGAGVGGVRAAILEMAGFSLQGSVTQSAENISYGGPIVPFDTLQRG